LSEEKSWTSIRITEEELRALHEIKNLAEKEIGERIRLGEAISYALRKLKSPFKPAGESRQFCKWILANPVPCRFPDRKFYESYEELLFCICCLFGWHLELSELKEKKKQRGK